MSSSDPLDILIRSDAWSTRIVLETCTRLTPEQFDREFPIGLGSLHEILTHIVSVMRRWTDRVAERPPRPDLRALKDFPSLDAESRSYTPADLVPLLDDAERDALDTARLWRPRLDTTVTVEWPASDGGGVKRYTFTRGAILVHMCTHGFHHRAQCLNILRHLNLPGVSDKLPEPSTVDWQAAIESPPILVV